MKTRTRSIALAAAALLAATAAAARAADYAGTYRGDKLTLDLSPDGSAYAGTLRMGEKAFPCKATEDGDHLAGRFASNGQAYPFTATVAGDQMTLTSGSTTYTLTRGGSNPLNPNPPGVNPLDGGPAPSQPGRAAPDPAALGLHTYAFPDGTGSIGVPDGWTCQAQSAADPVVVTGPAGQSVIAGGNTSVQTPDSPLMQMYQQNVSKARELGMQPPPPMQGILCAPFSDPVDAKPLIMKQLSDMNAQRFGWTMQFGRASNVQPTHPNLAGGRAQTATYTYTIVGRDHQSVPHTVDARLEADPCGPGGWMLCEDGGDAPTATYAHDAPTMLAIYHSLKVDQEALRKVWAARNQANRPSGGGGGGGGGTSGGGSAGGGTTPTGPRDGGMADASHQAAKHTAEFLSGQQRVENTISGEVRYVDYSNSTAIVQGLNDAPGSNGGWVIVHE